LSAGPVSGKSEVSGRITVPLEEQRRLHSASLEAGKEAGLLVVFDLTDGELPF